jgi:dTDP-4-amino-4,6-dideoxygalactose transaminase
VAALYRQRLPGLRFQHVYEGCRSTYKDVAVLVKDPDALGAALAAEGIETKRYFMPNHFMDPFQHLGPFDLPVTESVYSQILCLPIHNEIERADLDYVTQALKAAHV